MRPFPDYEHMSFDDFFKMTKETPAEAFMRKASAEAASKLAHALDSSIQGFVNAIEGRDVPFTEVARSGMFVKLATSAQDAPDAWENFFVYRGQALAYRYLTGTHANDLTHAVNMEFTLQTLPLPREQWPVALANYIQQHP